jgi:hypothetical protein
MFIMTGNLEFELTLVRVVIRTGQTDLTTPIWCRSLSLVEVRQASYFKKGEEWNEMLLHSYSGSFMP